MRQKFHIDFVKHSKKFFIASLGIMIVCLLLNLTLLPTIVDIQFTGGTIIKYNYGGEPSHKNIEKIVNDTLKGIDALKNDKVDFSYSENLSPTATDETRHIVALQFTGNKAVSIQNKQAVTDALQKGYPKNSFAEESSTAVDASKGTNFFLKCLIAVILAAVLMIFYVAVRFRKIGGLSAGVMAVVALIHDLIIVYFCFVIFRMPLNDNFIAVVLMILGYSLNDTIVIYDRIRENRKKSGPKTTTAELVNNSLNQCMTRTICTSITTIIAIGSVLVVALIYGISSILSFALPMMIGLISGSYSSLCIAAPLWVLWKNHKDKKKAEKRKNAPKSSKSSKNNKKSKKTVSDSKQNTDTSSENTVSDEQSETSKD